MSKRNNRTNATKRNPATPATPATPETETPATTPETTPETPATVTATPATETPATRKPDLRKPATAHESLPGNRFHTVGQSVDILLNGTAYVGTIKRFTPAGKFTVTIADHSPELSANFPLNNHAVITQLGKSEYRRYSDILTITPTKSDNA